MYWLVLWFRQIEGISAPFFSFPVSAKANSNSEVFSFLPGNPGMFKKKIYLIFKRFKIFNMNLMLRNGNDLINLH